VFVIGEGARHRSIYSGIKALPTDIAQDDIVVIHDAVRPFLHEDFLERVVNAARTYKASGAVKNLVSTIIKSTDDSFMEESLQRSKYRESHTPQAFYYSILQTAYAKCTDDDFDNGTEILHLVSKYCNIQAKLVDGPDYLWKVTHEKDIALMELYLKNNWL